MKEKEQLLMQTLAVRYDYDDQNTPQPSKIALPSVGGAGTFMEQLNMVKHYMMHQVFH